MKTIFRNLVIGVVLLTMLAVPSLNVHAAGLAIDPTSASKSGAPGTTVNYSITVSNTDAVPADFSYSTSSTKNWISPAAGTTHLDADGGANDQIVLTFSVNIPSNAANGDVDTATITFSTGQTATLTTTAAVAPTPAPASKPLITLASYAVDVDSITPGKEFGLTMNLNNIGGVDASNVTLSFSGDNFYPLNTGGMVAVSNIPAGSSRGLGQRFQASGAIPYGTATAPITVNVAYTDSAGTPYTASFTLVIDLATASYSGVAGPTRTPTTVARAQMVVSSYQADVDPLQPGTMFTLKLQVKNMGSADARAVTVILGGGGTQEVSGTPAAGGVSGGSSDLTNFAPLGSSNLIYVGDIAAGATMDITANLIVNTTTNPGAYPFKLSFVYADGRNARLTDDQVITLLVYSLPQVDVNFYRDPGMMMAGMDNILPLQVTNLGKKTSVLGNMTVTSEQGTITNNTGLVGSLEPGGYFTLDADFIPDVDGPATLTVTINYTDDFNQSRTITQTINVNVDPAYVEPTPDPAMMGDGGMVTPVATEETFWDKALRFIKGLLGLDSSAPAPASSGDEMVPVEEPVAIPGGKG